MLRTHIEEIDAFIDAEIELIAGEENADEKSQLLRIMLNGMRTILLAQAQLPAKDDSTSSERTKRRIDLVKKYIEESKHGKPTGQSS